MTTKLDDLYVTPTVAAKALGVSRGTILNRIARGELTGTQIAGRTVVLRESLQAAAKLALDTTLAPR